ncbi:phosphatase and actin regulator 4A isoform X2 [Ictalurus punctatus]|uniref:Phosphatase and actin regulator 4 n=1 Tax=Ictalurus punctatus TaxID=7998 RepID=A0A2D0S367_ICTPU|nr:phosphatase and actin regulator 4A isoform X2 [Ictalurus punctatus]
MGQGDSAHDHTLHCTPNTVSGTIVASDCCSWLIGVQPDVVPCCCRTSTSRLSLSCVLRRFSAHHGQKKIKGAKNSQFANDDDVDNQQNSTIGNDNPSSGRDTPPSKQKGKFSNLGKIFKPWKWRKKKESSEKFKETSEVLERKISLRRPRQELIDKGVLKEISENESNNVKAPSVKNGHMLPVSGDQGSEAGSEVKSRPHGEERKSLLAPEPERRSRIPSDVTRNRQPLDVDARTRIPSDSEKRERDEARHRERRDENRERGRRDDREDREKRDRREERDSRADWREERERRDRREERRDVRVDKDGKADRDQKRNDRDEREMREDRERKDIKERKDDHNKKEEPLRHDDRERRPESERRDDRERKDDKARREERERNRDDIARKDGRKLELPKLIRPQSEMDMRSSSSDVGQKIRPVSEIDHRSTLPRYSQTQDDPRARTGSVGVRFTPAPESKEQQPPPKQAILPPKWLMSSTESGQVSSSSSSSSSSLSSSSSSSAPPIAKPPPRTASLLVDDSSRQSSVPVVSIRNQDNPPVVPDHSAPPAPAPAHTPAPAAAAPTPAPAAPPTTSDAPIPAKMPPVPPPKPTNRNSTLILQATTLPRHANSQTPLHWTSRRWQTEHGAYPCLPSYLCRPQPYPDVPPPLVVSNPVPSKRSPPIPPARMTPVTKRNLGDPSSNHAEPPARSSSPNPPPSESEDSKHPSSTAGTVSPPPSHIPPSPPGITVEPSSPTTEPPSHPPSIPLHILIQRALNSPGPVEPNPDGNHRAHSMLFEMPPEVTEVETSGRHSLPVTIEPLRLPEDDDFDMEEELQKLHPPPRQELEAGSRWGFVGDPMVIFEDSDSEQEEDNDSDGPILYRDDADEDDEEDVPLTGLAGKVKRKDTLALKLEKQQEREEKQGQENSTWRNREQWEAMRNKIGTTLTRRLSQRPTPEELEQRNILQAKNEADRRAERSEIKRRLTRKLSQRPTVAELQARKILRFHEYVECTHAEDYDRRADKPWTKLTPADKAAIRKELNEFKSSEMDVHEDSRMYTRFHRP